MVITSFVSARVNSSRLPNKCLLPFGETTVLRHGIRRARDNGLNPIVCTPSSPENDVIAEAAEKEKVKCFRGHNDDRLRRWLDCANENKISAFHTVDVDDPFFDPEMMKASFSLLIDEDFDFVEPTTLASSGNACVGFSIRRSIVEKACKLYQPGENSELLWYYLKAVENYRSIILPQSDFCSSVEARLTLDYEEDYWLLQSICRILGNNATRQQVDLLLEDNPRFKEINWFRNDQWKEKQSHNPVTQKS
tara:strand:- start:901 stop:1650 length:750 start_codon:yes stop_codon:yes gene_type:complete